MSECSSNKSGVAGSIAELYFLNCTFVTFKRNKNLQEIIGLTIKNGKVFHLETHLENRKRKCEPCNTKKPLSMLQPVHLH